MDSPNFSQSQEKRDEVYAKYLEVNKKIGQKIQ